MTSELFDLAVDVGLFQVHNANQGCVTILVQEKTQLSTSTFVAQPVYSDKFYTVYVVLEFSSYQDDSHMTKTLCIFWSGYFLSFQAQDDENLHFSSNANRFAGLKDASHDNNFVGALDLSRKAFPFSAAAAAAHLSEDS